MHGRNRLTTSNMADTSRGNRFAAPLSSHRTGARLRTGGDGDGGTANWKTTPVPQAAAASSRISASARPEKHTIASTLRAASIRNKALSQKPISPRRQGPPPATVNGDRKFSNRLTVNSDRVWTHRKPAGGSPKRGKLEVALNDGMVEDQPTVSMVDHAVQTNEAEILNRELLVGDIKLLMPSVQIVKQIDKMRWEKTKMQLETTRKFATHEHDEEQHLDELKEYTERSYVTRRAPKKPANMLSSYEPNQYRNVFKYMDECFTREIPKAESITNIQDRIKRKEQELMSMFNDVDADEQLETDSEEN